MKIHTYSLGPVQTNCYILEHADGSCLIIDPGEEGERLVQDITARKLRPLAILLTHAHFDHIGAVDIVRNHFAIPVYVHEAEQEWLTDPALNGSGKYLQLPNIQIAHADRLIQREEQMEIGPFVFQIAHTPGHSPGSVSYIFKEEQVAIVGDTLFREGVGRTDLVGGDTALLLASIHSKLLTLDDEFSIYPGHGPLTTPAYEKDVNPFLHGF